LTVATAGEESSERLEHVLEGIRRKGVTLWFEDGRLRYKAPRGALTEHDKETLGASQARVAALLGTAADLAGSEPLLAPRSRRDCAPLAFSQLAHWNLYRLGERTAIRQVAAAVRLRGPLHMDALRRAFAEVIRRHEALRTRIGMRERLPFQIIDESGDCELEVIDERSCPPDRREAQIQKQLEQLIMEPIDVARGPLTGMRILRLGDRDNVLAVAMEHMISDGFSRGIFLHDLFAGYSQALAGDVFSLPAVPIQFADYATWQQDALRSSIARHGSHWQERLGNCRRVSFPENGSVSPGGPGWATVPLRIDGRLKAELREWSRLNRTTLVMSVFCAYVGLVLRWCHVAHAVIQYQSGSRSPEVENAIGYFSSPLYLRMELLEHDTFLDLVARTTAEYCAAYEHADYSYLESRQPKPGFTCNTCFNWVPEEPAFGGANRLAEGLELSPVPFEHPMLKGLERDSEPFVLLQDTAQDIVGNIYFSRERLSPETMERFGRNLTVFLKALSRHPTTRVKDVVLIM
jgi:hypothetical protein